MAYIQNVQVPFPNDGTVLVASNSITTDTQTTAVEVDRGRYDIVYTVTGFTTGTAYDVCTIFVEANTAAAPTVWKQIPGALVLGDASGVGPNLTATGTFKVSIDNPYDYQIRLNVQLTGSAKNLTYAAKLYPLRDSSAV
jgi:hypothetical protein